MYVLETLKKEFKEWGLKINLAKTEYMCVGGNGGDLMLEDRQCDKKMQI